MISAQASGGGAVPSGMLWWKVELDKSGAILTVEQVADVAKGSKLVAYVQAMTKAEACTEAKAWCERRRRQALDRVQALRERRRNSGACVRCGKQPPKHAGGAECASCILRVKQLKASAKAGRSGLKRQAAEDAESMKERQLSNIRNWKLRHPSVSWPYSKLWDKLQAEGVHAFELWLVQNMSDVERQERGLDVAKAAE